MPQRTLQEIPEINKLFLPEKWTGLGPRPRALKTQYAFCNASKRWLIGFLGAFVTEVLRSLSAFELGVQHGQNIPCCVHISMEKFPRAVSVVTLSKASRNILVQPSSTHQMARKQGGLIVVGSFRHVVAEGAFLGCKILRDHYHPQFLLQPVDKPG